MPNRLVIAGSLLSALVLGSSALAQPASADYRAEVTAWRQKREERLRAEGGWLSVAGLAWLKEGRNRVGSAPDSDVVLPGQAPAETASITLSEGRAVLSVAPSVDVRVDGKPVTSLTLVPDTAPDHQVLEVGSLWLQLIERQGRLGIRIKDMDNRRRLEFPGLEWYPVEERYRIRARFVSHPSPKPIPITNVLGQVEDLSSPGYATFTWAGQEVALHPVLDSTESQVLFFIFRDGTSGKTTYGGGRFLYSPLPKAGEVELDFNKAFSPPCAFTDFATCPLPPPQNRLPVSIEAGEKTPPGGH
jgi:uncharacterized protein